MGHAFEAEAAGRGFAGRGEAATHGARRGRVPRRLVGDPVEDLGEPARRPGRDGAGDGLRRDAHRRLAEERGHGTGRGQQPGDVGDVLHPGETGGPGEVGRQRGQLTDDVGVGREQGARPAQVGEHAVVDLPHLLGRRRRERTEVDVALDGLRDGRDDDAVLDLLQPEQHVGGDERPGRPGQLGAASTTACATTPRARATTASAVSSPTR